MLPHPLMQLKINYSRKDGTLSHLTIKHLNIFSPLRSDKSKQKPNLGLNLNTYQPLLKFCTKYMVLAYSFKILRTKLVKY